MAQLDPRIILAGEPADVPGAFARGLRMRQQAQAGEQDLRFGDLREQQAKQQIGKGEREATYMDARRSLALVDRAATPELWDGIAQRVAPELVGQFDKRDVIRAALEATVDAYNPQTPDETKVMKAWDGSIIQLTPNGAGSYDVQALTEGSGPTAPSGYQYGEGGSLSYIPGGPADPKTREALQSPGSSLTLADGTRIDLFGGAGAKLGTAANNKLDEKAINAAEVLTGLTQVQESFDPKFLEFETRFGTAFSRLKDRFGTASDEDKAAITEFANFKRRSLDLLSKQLNALSGAAVSPQEFERISATLPHAGSGLLDGDSPAEFEGKMKDSILQMRAAVARYQIWKERGGVGGPEEIQNIGSLDSPENIIAIRIDMLTKRLAEQGVTDPDEVDALISSQIKQEFGL